jgi:hypothetical protein
VGSIALPADAANTYEKCSRSSNFDLCMKQEIAKITNFKCSMEADRRGLHGKARLVFRDHCTTIVNAPHDERR